MSGSRSAAARARDADGRGGVLPGLRLRRPTATLGLAVGVAAVLLWLVLYPNLFVVVDSLRGETGLTLGHYTRFFRRGAELEALWNSVWISAASVLLAGAVGVPLAFLFARHEFPGRRVLGALASMPVLLPPLVGTIAFLFLYGETGFFTRGLQLGLGLDSPPWRLSGPGAILLVHAFTMYVYFYLFTSAGLARLDDAYAEAAAALGASRATIFRRVTLPMLAPAVGGAALLVFMTSMGSFSAPYVFGGGFRVLTTQIFASKLNGDLAMVAVETVVLASVSLVFLALLQRYEAGRTYTGAGKGLGAGGGRRAGAVVPDADVDAGGPSGTMDGAATVDGAASGMGTAAGATGAEDAAAPGGPDPAAGLGASARLRRRSRAAAVRHAVARWGPTALAAAGVGMLLLPHATVLLISFVPQGTWTTQLVPPAYSLENYRTIFTDAERLRPILNSLRMATIATVGNVALAVAAAYLLVRKRFRGRGLLGALTILPWALPGTVLAIALATTFSVDSAWTGRFVLVGTAAILPLTYFIRNIPLVTRAALASFRQFDPALEEAAASLGARWTTTLRRVTLPLVLPGLAAGALLAFVTALGEFVASILLYTHRTRPISIEILSQLRAFDFGAAAAYSVLLILLMAVVFVLGYGKVGDDAMGM